MKNSTKAAGDMSLQFKQIAATTSENPYSGVHLSAIQLHAEEGTRGYPYYLETNSACLLRRSVCSKDEMIS